MTAVRILVVDDHPIFAGGLRALFDTDDALTVVGTAHTAADAVALAGRERPDVVLMDLRLPDGDGITATAQILAANPQVAVVVLTMNDDEPSIAAAIRAGARGYLLKDTDDRELLTAIHSVAQGQAVFGQSVAPRLTGVVGSSPSRRAFPQLTERESEILHLMACGLSNPEITAQLVLSPKTVRNHVSNILTKLNAPSRARAILAAREAGLG